MPTSGYVKASWTWISLKVAMRLDPQAYPQIPSDRDAHNMMDHMAVEAPGRIFPPRSGRRLMVQLVLFDVPQCLFLPAHALHLV